VRAILGLVFLATLGAAFYSAWTAETGARVSPVYMTDDGEPRPSPKPPMR